MEIEDICILVHETSLL